MYIDHLKEYELLQGVLRRLPKVDSSTTLVLNVSPDYSSIVAMQVAHYLSAEGRMLDLFVVEVPYPKEDKDYYRKKFKEEFRKVTLKYDTVILCEAAVLSGNNYTWIKEVIMDFGYEDGDIITIALLEMETSVFKSDYVGAYISEMPEFYWERYNKNWD